jgi:hypothetical protein
VVAGVLAGGLLGCAPSRWMEGSVLVVPGKGYRIALPTDWERLDTEADVAVRHRTLGVVLMAHGTCEGKAPSRSLPVLARHLRFGLQDVQRLAAEPMTMAGHAALRSRFSARLDGAAVAVEAVTVLAQGCAYDLVAVAPVDRSEAATAAFERFVGGFGLGGGAR